MKTPGFWYRDPGLLSTLLAPFSLLYAAGRLIDQARAPKKALPLPVICIGNAVAGGAGKTPTTIALARLLQDAGTAAHIVTRGYGGMVTGVVRVKAGDVAVAVGDEALLLAEVAPTWVSPNRKLGIGCALAAGAQAVLLDDGLQHTKLRAPINILVIDGASGFGNGQLLPAGPLREFPSQLKQRIDAIVMIGTDTQHIAQQFSGVPVFTAQIVSDLSVLDPAQRYAAFAGLARPEKFFATAETSGLNLVARKSFADHHLYDAKARAGLRQWAAEHQAKLLTTAKDAMRWPVEERSELTVLPITLAFEAPDQVRQFLQDKLDAAQ